MAIVPAAGSTYNTLGELATGVKLVASPSFEELWEFDPLWL